MSTQKKVISMANRLFAANEVVYRNLFSMIITSGRRRTHTFHNLTHQTPELLPKICSELTTMFLTENIDYKVSMRMNEVDRKSLKTVHSLVITPN